MATRGGVSSFVVSMASTPLWEKWNVKHIATHRDGSALAKIGQFAVSVPIFVYHLVVDRPVAVHLHSSSDGSFYRKYLLNVLARLFRVPVVMHVHGSEFHEFYAGSPSPVQWAIRSSLRGSHAVIALGRTWARRLEAIEPDARVLVVPNAVRPCGEVGQPSADEPVHVLFLGRVGERKGTFTLLEAWQSMLSSTTRNARLTVAGDGEVDRAKSLVASLGVGDTVEVLGWVSQADVPPIMREAQVLVLPSHNEGQPMAILESMANGLCVISSPVGGIPDLIDETCGVLVPPGEVDELARALGDIVQNDATRIRLGGAALKRVRDEFDVDVIWRRFDDLYTEVGR